MIYLIFASFTLVHLCLLIWSGRCVSSGSRWRLSYLRMLLVGLMLDNAVLALGSVWNGTPFYDPATRLRFFLHGAIFPFLTPDTLSIMRDVNVR